MPCLIYGTDIGRRMVPLGRTMTKWLCKSNKKTKSVNTTGTLTMQRWEDCVKFYSAKVLHAWRELAYSDENENKAATFKQLEVNRSNTVSKRYLWALWSINMILATWVRPISSIFAVSYRHSDGKPLILALFLDGSVRYNHVVGDYFAVFIIMT